IMKTIFKERLARQERQSLLRKRNVIQAIEGNRICIDGKYGIDFSSNDYLGLRKYHKIADAFAESARKYGFGSGASALVSGYSDEHAKTEYLFSKWLGVDKTILFNSGYSANVGVMSALTGRSDIIFSDKFCHASILDGIALSRAKHRRYQHCNLPH